MKIHHIQNYWYAYFLCALSLIICVFWVGAIRAPLSYIDTLYTDRNGTETVKSETKLCGYTHKRKINPRHAIRMRQTRAHTIQYTNNNVYGQKQSTCPTVNVFAATIIESQCSVFHPLRIIPQTGFCVIMCACAVAAAAAAVLWNSMAISSIFVSVCVCIIAVYCSKSYFQRKVGANKRSETFSRTIRAGWAFF